MTLQELKKKINVSGHGGKVPTAKQLRESGRIVAQEKVGTDSELSVYENGYVCYRTGKHVTVFSLSSCGDYFYLSGKHAVHLPELFFAQEEWYLRLVLEGEDRLNRNQEEKERSWNVSYSAVSEEWAVLENQAESAVRDLIRRETVKEVLRGLPEKQKSIVEKYYLQGETQEQISRELGISQQAVSERLSQAVRSIQNRHLDLSPLFSRGICCMEERA